MVGERSEQPLAGLFTQPRRRDTLIKPLIRFATQQPLGLIGAVVLVVLIVVAIFAPVISPHDPYKINLSYKYQPPGTTTEEGERFLLGACPTILEEKPLPGPRESCGNLMRPSWPGGFPSEVRRRF